MSVPDPNGDRALRRARPRDLQRVLLGYLVAVLALLCGVPALVIGWVSAANCTAEGFACLGYLVYGGLGGILLAVVALPLLAWRLRLGLWFALLTIALVVAPLWLADGSLPGGTAFLGPGLAAWVSEPRTPDPATLDPLAPAPAPTSDARHWIPRFAAVLGLSILMPLLGRVI